MQNIQPDFEAEVIFTALPAKVFSSPSRLDTTRAQSPYGYQKKVDLTKPARCRGTTPGISKHMNGLNLPKLCATILVAASALLAIEAAYAVEADADRILRAMGGYLKSADAFTFRADITYDEVLSTGEKAKYDAVADLSVRRPNRLLVSSDGDEFHRQVFYDGKTITLFNVQEGLYAVTKVPSKLDSALDLVFEKFGLEVPVADFFYADPYAVLIENADYGGVLGEHGCGELRCHHLLFTQEFIDWQIWIETGPRPVPHRLVITYKDEPASPQYEARFSRWEFQPRLSEHAFTFVPPDGAVEIEFLPSEPDAGEEAQP